MTMPKAVRDAITRSHAAYVASVDPQGRPHLAVSKLIRVIDAEHVAFTGWFCPQTTQNIRVNPRVAIAIWRPEEDIGYQIVGEVIRSDVTAVVDGWDGKNNERGLPQEEHKLIVRVTAVLEFRAGAHTDDSIA